MLDVRWARENPEALDKALARRGVAPISARVLALDVDRRSAQTRFQDAQSQRREASKAIGQAKAKGEDASKAMAAVALLKADADTAEQAEKAAAAELDALMATLPNVPHDDVPDGLNEDDNVLVRTVGSPGEFTFEPKDHIVLGAPLGMDFDAGAKNNMI
ncbi:MAG: serine--tRNA ligase, partial [Alphaproteobacteria bacterium]